MERTDMSRALELIQRTLEQTVYKYVSIGPDDGARDVIAAHADARVGVHVYTERGMAIDFAEVRVDGVVVRAASNERPATTAELAREAARLRGEAVDG